jgi:hypothetical protein
MVGNQYERLVNHIKSILQSNEYVNTVLYARSNESDLYKKNITPLAHIIPTGANRVKGGLKFNFEVGVLDIVNKSNNTNYDKFDGNDDKIDTHNATYYVLDDLLTQLDNGMDEFTIELTSTDTIQPIFYSGMNTLDGWMVGFSITVVKIGC